jgi:hypothetical protein
VGLGSEVDHVMKIKIEARNSPGGQCCGSDHLDADPGSTYHPDADADPDSDFFYADSDPTLHPDAYPDPEPSFKKRLKP